MWDTGRRVRRGEKGDDSSLLSNEDEMNTTRVTKVMTMRIAMDHGAFIVEVLWRDAPFTRPVNS